MIDERLTPHVNAALATEPPLGFDPDDVVDSAISRQHRRRRITAVVGTTVAAVAAVATIGTLVGSDPGVAPADSSLAAVGCPADPVSEMSPVIADLVAEHVPALQLEPPTYDVSRASHIADWCGIDADYRFVGDPERGGLRVELFVGKDAVDLYSNLTGASVTKLPDGSRLVVSQGKEHLEKGDGSLVAHLRLDGQVAVAFITRFEKASVEQLTAIATDPRLAF